MGPMYAKFATMYTLSEHDIRTQRRLVDKWHSAKWIKYLLETQLEQGKLASYTRLGIQLHNVYELIHSR